MITVYDFEQRSPEWEDARRGMVTASIIGGLITPKTMQPANNEMSRALTALLVSERITGVSEPTFTSMDMERGVWDEPLACEVYSKTWAEVREVGLIVREEYGRRLGYSPDGLVGNDGLIEVKSRRAKNHLLTILADEVPAENMAQIQCGLFVSDRAWCDYVSYCGGMPMWRKRVFPDLEWQRAIVAALIEFEERAAAMVAVYEQAIEGLPLTERVNHFPEIEF